MDAHTRERIQAIGGDAVRFDMPMSPLTTFGVGGNAEAVFKAYSEAKLIAYQHMAKVGWYDDMLPWYAQEFEETRELMGNNFYSYGIGPNRKTLEALFRYSYHQGLSSRELKIEDLFDPLGLELAEPEA